MHPLDRTACSVTTISLGPIFHLYVVELEDCIDSTTRQHRRFHFDIYHYHSVDISIVRIATSIGGLGLSYIMLFVGIVVAFALGQYTILAFVKSEHKDIAIYNWSSSDR